MTSVLRFVITIWSLLIFGSCAISVAAPTQRRDSHKRAATLAPRLVVQTGHSVRIHCVALSPDQKLAATGSQDWNVKLWDVQTGLELRTFVGHQGQVKSIHFSTNGSLIVSRDEKNQIRVWDTRTGQSLAKQPPSLPPSASRGPLKAKIDNYRAIIVEKSSGKVVQVLGGLARRVTRIWSTPEDNKMVLATLHPNSWVRQESAQVISHWDWLDISKQDWRLRPGSFHNSLSPDGRLLARREDDGLHLLQAHTGKETQFAPIKNLADTAWSPDGTRIAVAAGNQFSVWRLAPLEKMIELRQTQQGDSPIVENGQSETHTTEFITFSPDGKRLAGATQKEILLWDATTGALLNRWRKSDTSRPGYSKFNDGWFVWSRDGRFLAIAGNQQLQIFNVQTGKLAGSWTSPHRIATISYAPQGNSLVIGLETGLRIWDVTKSAPGPLIVAGENFVTSLAWFQQGKILASGSFDGAIHFWEFGPQLKQLGTFVSLESGEWAFSDPQGRYDASKGGDITGMHWVVGTTPIELKQLKQRFYVPNLLTKVLSGEQLPTVKGLEHIDLPPTVQAAPIKMGQTKLALHLKNQGGGIGRVQVFVNGKELSADARSGSGDPSQLTVDLSGAAVATGRQNQIKIVTWNREGYISGRGFIVNWTPQGAPEAPEPHLWAIVVGTSDYQNPQMNLRFAAKDAEDFAHALRLGGVRLFGEERVHLSLFSSSGASGSLPPTKAHIQSAFQEAAQRAKPSDILVVYFAGHGVALQRGSDLYCYLTRDARSTDASVLSDPAVRAAVTVSNDDLATWMTGKQGVKALKQVLILDTCAAGAVGSKFSDNRAISGDQIRALERLKDRTGFHILMGCTSDAVSYEASRYGQGVLTYALLQGMKGAALREDRFVDVSRLFQYAADEVPRLAQSVGGIQRPQIKAPGAASFDFGRLDMAERTSIPLAQSRPMLLRPILLNASKLRDDLGLSSLVRRGLREATAANSRGNTTPVFVDAEAGELPGALAPTGTYRVEGETVRVEIVLAEGEREVGHLMVEGQSNAVEALATKVVTAILEIKVP